MVDTVLFQRPTLKRNNHVVGTVLLRRRNPLKARIRRTPHRHGRPDGISGVQKSAIELKDMQRETVIRFCLFSSVVYPPLQIGLTHFPVCVFSPTAANSKYFACDPRICRDTCPFYPRTYFLSRMHPPSPREFAIPLFATQGLSASPTICLSPCEFIINTNGAQRNSFKTELYFFSLILRTRPPNVFPRSLRIRF